MVRKDKKGNKVVYFCSRKDIAWVCTECSKEYRIAPTQCSCGASDKVFIEKDVLVEETERKEYVVKESIIYDATIIDQNSIVSMVVNDRVTKNLLKRKLISEVVKSEVK